MIVPLKGDHVYFQGQDLHLTDHNRISGHNEQSFPDGSSYIEKKQRLGEKILCVRVCVYICAYTCVNARILAQKSGHVTLAVPTLLLLSKKFLLGLIRESLGKTLVHCSHYYLGPERYFISKNPLLKRRNTHKHLCYRLIPK